MTQRQSITFRVFLPQLYQALEAAVGEQWLFERGAVGRAMIGGEHEARPKWRKLQSTSPKTC